MFSKYGLVHASKRAGIREAVEVCISNLWRDSRFHSLTNSALVLPNGIRVVHKGKHCVGSFALKEIYTIEKDKLKIIKDTDSLVYLVGPDV